jgi:FKBP-type peptidyl-prolyl cis-trans isomerase
MANKREYSAANKRWLEEKSQEEGVKALPKGIYYKVLAEGKNDGVHPSPRSIVTAHYTGRTIDGRLFDSSRSGAPLAVRLCDLIEGWIIAMQHMCVADKWEVYIPSEMGYGKFSQPGIPGGSTLIFEIELLGIA